MRRLLEFLIFSAVLGFAPNSLAGSVDCEALKQGTVPFEIVGRNADTRVTTPRMIMQVIPGQGRQTVWRVLEQTEYESIDGPVTKRTSVAVIKSILQNSFATDIEGRKIKDVTSKFQESKSTNTYDGLDLMSVDSPAPALEIAARAAFREALVKARSVLLEPIMKVVVVSPEDCIAYVISDLNRRRGRIQGQDMRDSNAVIDAMVPLMNMFGYVNNLRSMSQSRATFVMRFDHYAPAYPQGDDPPFRPAIGLRG